MLTVSTRIPAMRLPLPDKHWATSAVLATLLFLYLFAGLSVTGVEGNGGRAFAQTIPAAWQASKFALPQEPAPVPEPLAFREMAPLDAVTYNASIPVSSESNPAARPFVLKAASEADRLRSLDCLTAAVYYEAAIENDDGQRAVAQVVLNRMRHPAFPKTICGVVFQGSERSTGCQFTFTCDGALARTPSEAGWARARRIAEAALDGKVYKPVGYSTHYHTNWVVPYWSSSLTKVANVGTHIFYRWEGGWGRPPAFRFAYMGVEPQIASMRRLSSTPVEDLGEIAVLASAADLTDPGTGFVGRAVVRHYEPLREQSAADSRAALAKAEVPVSLRWALTGDAAPADAIPAAKQPQAPVVTLALPASAATKVAVPAAPAKQGSAVLSK